MAWMTCFVGDDRGALGAALEPDDAVREAAYVQRPSAAPQLEDTP